MQISWNGLGSYTFAMKTASGDVTVVTDPFASGDVKFPRSLAASLVVSSYDDAAAHTLDAIVPEYPEDKRNPFLVEHAGEFEVRGVAVTGVAAPRKDGTLHTIYRMDAENMHIGFLGALDRVLTDKEVEALGTVDVLIIPTGTGVLSASACAEVIAQIEPRLVIPSYAEDTSAFCRELSAPTESTPKLKLVRAGLPEEDMKIVTITM
ncbi:MAG: MBL fold metallo-hydrolase [Patescibacteria group bacterium]